MEDSLKIKKKAEDLISVLGFSGEAIITKREAVLYVNLQIDEPNVLIGKDGEGLDALQHILRLLVSLKESARDAFLVLDVNGYRKKKNQTIEALAKEIAHKVRTKKVEIELEPMNSYERRIVHTIITNIADVESESRGEGRNRRIVVKPKK